MLNRIRLDLDKANRRITVLETLLCPDGHTWMTERDNKGRLEWRCTRCYKLVTAQPDDANNKEE